MKSSSKTGKSNKKINQKKEIGSSVLNQVGAAITGATSGYVASNVEEKNNDDDSNNKIQSDHPVNLENNNLIDAPQDNQDPNNIVCNLETMAHDAIVGSVEHINSDSDDKQKPDILPSSEQIVIESNTSPGPQSNSNSELETNSLPNNNEELKPDTFSGNFIGIDVNHDGKHETMTWDINYDNHADIMANDSNNDGKVHFSEINYVNENVQKVETMPSEYDQTIIVLDKENDGFNEVQLLDQNMDQNADIVLIDNNQNQQIDENNEIFVINNVESTVEIDYDGEVASDLPPDVDDSELGQFKNDLNNLNDPFSDLNQWV